MSDYHGEVSYDPDPYCDQEYLDVWKYVLETGDQEHQNQETYDQTDYAQEHSDQEYRDQVKERPPGFIDNDNIADEPRASTKECKSAREPQTHVYAVIYEFHGFYVEPEYEIAGVYGSLEKANAAALSLFEEKCPDYVSDLEEDEDSPSMGKGVEWTAPDGGFEFETFDEGCDGFRTLIYVTKRMLN